MPSPPSAPVPSSEPFTLSDPQPLLDAATFDASGLVAAVAQDDATGDVLMLAYMTRETLRQTLETDFGPLYAAVEALPDIPIAAIIPEDRVITRGTQQRVPA